MDVDVDVDVARSVNFKVGTCQYEVQKVRDREGGDREWGETGNGGRQENGGDREGTSLQTPDGATVEKVPLYYLVLYFSSFRFSISHLSNPASDLDVFTHDAFL